MITTIAAVLLCSVASAAQPAAPAGPSAAPAVRTSTAAASAAPAAAALGVSTYTVSTLYTGDKVRDPFLPASVGGSSHPRDRNAPLVVDIHALELRGIMKDGKSDFAIFSMESGGTLVLRGNRLYDDHNKIVPGITGLIKMKQKRAELITADKDVQIYSLGEPDVSKPKDKQSDGTE